MFRRTLIALIVAATPFGAAHALPVTLQFTATDLFRNWNGIPDTPSFSSVSGTIVWDAVDAHSPINSLTSVSMVIDGYSYTSANTVFMAPLWGIGTTFFLGGGLCGVATCFPNGGIFTNDFMLTWDAATLTPYNFNFSSSASSGSWAGNRFSAFSITAVPEPENYAMMLAGLGLLGFLSRRQKGISGQAA